MADDDLDQLVCHILWVDSAYRPLPGFLVRRSPHEEKHHVSGKN